MCGFFLLCVQKIGIYTDQTAPSLYRLYCPYWVCNKTGLGLEYEYYVSQKNRSVVVTCWLVQQKQGFIERGAWPPEKVPPSLNSMDNFAV